MQTLKNLNTNQINILYRICKNLQNLDIKNGYHIGKPHTGNYMQSYFKLSLNPQSNTSPFTLTDILDDAWNCNLITESEYSLFT